MKRGSGLGGRAAGVGIGLLAAACAPADPVSGASVGVARAAIVGGDASPAERDAVVFLVHVGAKGWEFSCSATLVAPNLLLTARHCVSEIGDPNVACDADGRQVAGGALGKDRDATGFAVYIGARTPQAATSGAPAAKGRAIVHDGAATLCGHDLAFLVLDRDVPNAVIAPLRLSAPPTVGEELVAVGYGQTSSGAAPAVRQERSGVRVRFVGPNADPAVAPRDFVVSESDCEGDSGGPGLSPLTGAVVGVATRVGTAKGTATCLDSKANPLFVFYTQMAAFGETTQRAFAAAGHEPWQEGQPAPGTANDPGCGPCALGARGGSGSRAGFAVVALLALRAARRSGPRSRRDRIRGS